MGKVTQTCSGQRLQILSRSDVPRRREGCQLSLHFSSGENSSGPRAISAQFCSYNFQSVHTCLCVTNLSLLDGDPKRR